VFAALCAILICLQLPVALATEGVADATESTARFVRDAFAAPPQADNLWITDALRPTVRQILGHDLRVVRLPYWRQGKRTAWVINEVGKEMPITVGVVVDDGRIERVRVLAYRESRGWEVQSANFLRQFVDARLGEQQQLDRSIDGIAGATLSVRAMVRVSRLALWLHQEAMQKAAMP
jgi:Na+-translocating ferredoxin:NAD+ oxidoreductase RnfG subunit